MATTIEELDFELKIKDNNFEEKIKGYTELAQQFNVDVSKMLEVSSKASKQVTSVEKAEAEERKRIQKEESEIIRQLEKEDAEYAKRQQQAKTQHQREQAEESKRISKQIAEYAKSIGETSDIQKQMSEFYKQQEKDAERVAKTQERAAKEAQKAVEKAAKEKEKAEKQAAKMAEKAAKEAARAAIQAHREEVNALASKYIQYRDLRKELTFQSSLFRQLKTLALTYFSVQAVRSFVTELVRVSSEFEKQKVALGSIINDTIKAESLFGKLQSLAVKSPFNFSELVSFTKQLSAFSIPVNELYNTTKMLADVSAGLGIDMGRIVLAFGQVASAEVLRGQEIRQFTEAGLPILKELAKQFSVIYDRAVSINEVFDLVSKRKVPFEMVKQVFIDLTSEGGKFYKMQEVLADTLSGKLANLKDAYQLMLYEIGQGNSGIINGAVDGLRTLIKNWEDVGRVLKVIIATWGAYKAFQIAEVIYREAQALKALKAALTAAEAAQLGLNTVSKASIWGAIAAGIVFAVSALIQYKDKLEEVTGAQKALDESASKYTNMLSSETTNLKLLLNKLSSLKEGTEEYEKAKKSLLVNYGQYLDDVDREQIKIGKLAGIYDKLSASIENNVKARISAMAQEKIAANYSSTMEDIKERALKTAKGAGLNQGQQLEYLYWLESGAELQKLDREIYRKIDLYMRSTISGRLLSGYSSGEASLDVTRAINERDSALKNAIKIYGEAAEDLNEIDKKFNYEEDSGSNPRIKQLEELIDLMLKFKSWSSELKSLGADSVKILSEIFPQYKDIAGIEDFDAAIKQTIDELRTLGEEGKTSAQKITDSLGAEAMRDVLNKTRESANTFKKSQEEAQRALESFKEGLSKFTPTIELDGTGVRYDVNVAIKAYKDGLQQINEEYNKLKQQAEAAKPADQGAYAGNILSLDKAQQDMVVNNQAKMYSKLFDLGKNYITEVYNLFKSSEEYESADPFKRMKLEKGFKAELEKLKNLDLSSLVSSVEAMEEQMGISFQEALVKTLSDNSVLPDSMKAIISDLSREMSNKSALQSAINSAMQGVAQQADTTKTKLDKESSKTSKFFDNSFANSKTGQWLSYAASGLSMINNQLNEFAKASDNQALRDGTEILGGMMDVFQGFMQGGVAGATMAAIKMAISTITEELAYSAKLEKAIRQARIEARLLKWEMMMDAESIFGANQVKQMDEALKVMDEILVKYGEIFSSITDGSKYIAQLNKGLVTFGNLSKNIANYNVLYNDRGGLANMLGFADQYDSLQNLMEGLGYDLYDKYGNLNAEGLRAILDTYDRLGAKDREWMEEAIDYSEEYQKAMEQIDDVLQDLYGQYVGDVVDTMIDKWIQLGIVTSDYADALSDVAKNYAKMAIQSAILENVFTDDFEKQLRDATINMDAQKVMKLFTQAQSQIEDMAPFIAEILESLDQYFVSESGSDSLSSGIKSITEETASLLASYVNAIRADVSVTRNNVGVISSDLKLIMGMLPSAPNLAEYLTQIQANTYNTQMATESILGELRAVIGTESGMTAVRVSM